MRGDLLLVGSVPFQSAEEVFTLASKKLGAHLSCIPDGEVLDRRFWAIRMMFQVFNGHPAIETLHSPAAAPGAEKLIPESRDDSWVFRLKPGVSSLKFDMLGWRLGYAKDAQNSYALFSAMKREGKIAAKTRFQVSLPSVNSVCNPASFDVDEKELGIIRAGFQEALVAETEMICKIIPTEELAIQFDCAREITDIHGGFGLPAEGAVERNLPQFKAIIPAVADGAQLGFHFCFGTFGGWPRFAPDNLATIVEFANGLTALSPRRIEWIHIPTLDTVDPDFYAPLANLETGEAFIYLGMIHSMKSFEERYLLARKYLRKFGLGTYCGLGRLAPEAVETCFDDHLRALDVIASVSTAHG